MSMKITFIICISFILLAACGSDWNPLGGSRSDNAFDPGNPNRFQLDSSWTPQWGHIVAYWRLNGSGKIAPGSLIPATVGSHGWATDSDNSLAFIEGKLEGAINFDGIDDQLEFGPIDIISGRTELTNCFWMYYEPLSATGDGALMAKWITGNGGYVIFVDDVGQFSLNQDTITVTVSGSGHLGARAEGSTGLVTSREWSHICATFKANAFVRLYKNGVLDTETTNAVVASAHANNHSFFIGASGTTMARFQGRIDEVAFWHKALTSEEILTIYNWQQRR